MDPDTNLQEQLELANALISANPDDASTRSVCDFMDDAVRLAELVLALDGWINGGGFLPKQWREE